MSYSTATSFIEFVNGIPSKTNAFLATADLLQSLTIPPALPTWTYVSTRLCLAGYVILLLQSVLLLAQRLKLGSFKTVHYNKLGLLAIRVSDPASICVFFYAAATIEFLASQLAEEKGSAQWWSEIVLFEIKPLCVLANAWAFLWVSSCQCAVIFWDTDLVSDLSIKRRELLQATIKWGMIIVFLLVAIAPIPLLICKASIAYSCFSQILSIVQELRASLIAVSDTFNPQTYNKLALLQLLIPAQGISPLFHEMESNTRFIIRFWMVLIGVLSFVCIPLLFWALGGLCKQTALKKLQSSKRHIQISRTRNQLVLHALAVYLSLAVNLPALVWLDTHSTTGFGMDRRWRAVCFHGISAPFCITGNIMILILNWNSRDALLEMKAGRKVGVVEAGMEDTKPNNASFGTSTCISSSAAEESNFDVVGKAV